MPLNTQIIRDGQELTLRWGGFHVAAMVLAAALDSGKGPFDDNTLAGLYEDGSELPDYPDEPIPVSRKDVFSLMSYGALAATPLGDGRYILKGRHHFVDIADGEDLVLQPGDVLVAQRSSR